MERADEERGDADREPRSSADVEAEGDEEEEEEIEPRGGFVAGLLVGLVLGAGVALLLAPAEGARTRTRLARRLRRLRRRAGPTLDHAARLTRRELERRRRRLQARLDRLADEARDRFD